MYVVFYVVFNRFTEKICPWHFRRWAGLCAHSRKKNLFQLSTFSKKVAFQMLVFFLKTPHLRYQGQGKPCVKSVRLEFFCSEFSRIQNEYGELLIIVFSPNTRKYRAEKLLIRKENPKTPKTPNTFYEMKNMFKLVVMKLNAISEVFYIINLNVACRVQICKKKTFCQNSEKFAYRFI